VGADVGSGIGVAVVAGSGVAVGTRVAVGSGAGITVAAWAGRGAGVASLPQAATKTVRRARNTPGVADLTSFVVRDLKPCFICSPPCAPGFALTGASGALLRCDGGMLAIDQVVAHPQKYGFF
jgi:hypothetical protein